MCLPVNFCMTEHIFMKFGMYIVAPEPISTAYFINRPHQSLSIGVSHIVARQRLGKYVTSVTNTHATIRELLRGVVFYAVHVVSRKVGFSVFPELLVYVTSRSKLVSGLSLELACAFAPHSLIYIAYRPIST
jgi:hypothetical protein